MRLTWMIVLGVCLGGLGMACARDGVPLVEQDASGQDAGNDAPEDDGDGPANNGPTNNGPANNGPANNGPANNGPANNGCGADLDDDVTNCGMCGRVCEVGPRSFVDCVRGVCVLSCEPGWEDANGESSDGCEAGCEPSVAPDETRCDGVDDDCDGDVDEDFVPTVGCGRGVCERQAVCSGGQIQCSEGSPTGDDANCDGLDDDCDGQIDEGYAVQTCGVGFCASVSRCEGGQETACTPGPGANIDSFCNGIDDDCDGEVDEEFVPETCGLGACRVTTRCEEGGGTTSCQPLMPPTSVDSTCDGIDDDCDGDVDEDFTPSGCSVGACSGEWSCVDGLQRCAPGQAMDHDVCGDGIDNDCNGVVDDRFICVNQPQQLPDTECRVTSARFDLETVRSWETTVTADTACKREFGLAWWWGEDLVSGHENVRQSVLAHLGSAVRCMEQARWCDAEGQIWWYFIAMRRNGIVTSRAGDQMGRACVDLSVDSGWNAYTSADADGPCFGVCDALCSTAGLLCCR